MNLQLTLPTDLVTRLQSEAGRRGETVDTLATRLLEQQLSRMDGTRAACELLEQWATEAESLSDDEAAANEAVLKAIDDDRLSDRKLFAPLLDGKSS